MGVQRLVVDVPVRSSTWGPRQYLDKVVDMPVACRENCGLSAVAAHGQGLGAEV